MEQNSPQPFAGYIPGEAVLARFVVHQGLVIPLPIFKVLRLAELKAPPVVNPQLQTYVTLSYLSTLRKEDNDFQMWIETAVNKIH